MRQSAYRLLACRAADCLVSLVTLALFSPGTVQAGCAATHRMPAARPHAQFALLAEAGALASSDRNLPASDRPCSGPMCKQGAPRPYSNIPSITRAGMEEWAIPVPQGESASVDTLDRPPLPLCVDGIDAACAIFHPPRSKSLATLF